MKSDTIHRLDSEFSKLVRLISADENGIVKDFITGEPRFWKYMVCGHFQKCANHSVRWNLTNCHPITEETNRRDEIHPGLYEESMVNFYGQDVVDDLKRLAKTEVHFTESEGLELLKEFRSKVKQLQNQLA
jgi:hypothetical protein